MGILHYHNGTKQMDVMAGKVYPFAFAFSVTPTGSFGFRFLQVGSGHTQDTVYNDFESVLGDWNATECYGWFKVWGRNITGTNGFIGKVVLTAGTKVEFYYNNTIWLTCNKGNNAASGTGFACLLL